MFHRNFVEPSIRGGVPGAVYNAIADFQHRHIALPILKTAWTCPRADVDNFQCTWMVAAEVIALRTSKDAAVASRASLAEGSLSKSRVLTDHVFEAGVHVCPQIPYPLLAL